MRQRRTVVVTGASAGVGRAAALEFGRAGDRVALLARQSERLEEAARSLDGQGMAFPVDVANADEVEAAASRVEEELGPIDVWVNNAMATVFSRFWDIDPKEFARVTEVTYLGTVYGTMAALKRMRERDHGVIVQVGSALAYRSIPLQSAYCGAKHAMVGFTDSLRSELIHEGSRVKLTVVHLPSINTPQFTWARSHLQRHPQPVPPIFAPEVAARAVRWASEHPRREYLVGAPTSMAVLGHEIAPGVGDAFLASEGYEGQMSDLPYDPGRADNLFEPVRDDVDWRGAFTQRAQSGSLQQRLVMRLPWPGIVEVASGALYGLGQLPKILRTVRRG